ncbi:hypothetical protein M422DRAFT_24513 [Sphaerobolus stellatus SS14]|nr:hypothetical protein M422DRAFT_24513 [Sphaerobolus stellatus SS14]
MEREPTPAFKTKNHHPYFTPQEVEALSTKQRGKLSTSQEEKQRQQACAFIEAVSGRTGFPRRTIATAQNLYHRFHLYFPRKDFNLYDVTLAALYVSSKMHDTLKKPQDLLMVSYVVRFPELAAKSKVAGGDVVMDPEKVEQDRQRLIAIERLILEMICFNFTSRMSFPYIIKLGRAVGASKHLINLAWRLATDSYRTMAPLLYPPHSVAVASIYLSGLLLSFEYSGNSEETTSNSRTSAEVAEFLGKPGDWEKRFHIRLEDLQEIAHMIMDLLMHESSSSSSAHTSPSTPQSPSPYGHPHPLPPQQTPGLPSPSIPCTPDQLTRLKIFMRENDVPRERRRHQMATYGVIGGFGGRDIQDGAKLSSDFAGLGNNQGTTRFLFGPPGSVLAG